MEQIIRIGMDTSKHIFQLHGVNAAEEPRLAQKAAAQGHDRIFRAARARRASRSRPVAARITGRACCTSLAMRFSCIAPQLVKPYVKRGKNDAADAEALCEAMSRPTMRFVPAKTAEQQAALMLVGPARPADPQPHPARPMRSAAMRPSSG